MESRRASKRVGMNQHTGVVIGAVFRQGYMGAYAGVQNSATIRDNFHRESMEIPITPTPFCTSLLALSVSPVPVCLNRTSGKECRPSGPTFSCAASATHLRQVWRVVRERGVAYWQTLRAQRSMSCTRCHRHPHHALKGSRRW